MANIEDIVEALENKINTVLNELETLKQNHLKLSQALAVSESKQKNQESLLQSWEQKYEALKIANAMLGSDDNKRETKLKINTLVRDLDHCIAQLSQ